MLFSVRLPFVVALSASLILAACLSRQVKAPRDPLAEFKSLNAEFIRCKDRYISTAFAIKKTAPLCQENIACHIGKVGEWRAAIGAFRQCAEAGDLAMAELANACSISDDPALMAECGRFIEATDGSEPGDLARSMADSHSQALDNIEDVITGRNNRGL